MNSAILRAGAFLVASLISSYYAWGQTPADIEASVPAMKLVLPERLAHDLPQLGEIPELPESAARLPDLTLEFRESVAGGKSAGLPEAVRILTRSGDRVHLRLSGRGDQEWLFQQNPVDRRRVSGLLIDHTEGVIVTHYESDLRNRGIAQGWIDVLALGFNIRQLDDLSPVGETTEFAGVRFQKMAREEPRQDGIVEVWWSEELLLPLRVMRQVSGVTETYELIQLTRQADAELLADPQKRFPRYTSVDVADWHENH